MGVCEVISYNYVTSDGKSLTLGYDPAGNILVKATIQIDGNFFQWNTIEDFNDFVENVVAMANVANSPSKGEGQLSISPTNVSLSGDLVYTFTPSGGTGIDYTFSVLAGTGTITTDGVFTAPDATEIDIIKLVDSNGNIAYALASISDAGINYISAYAGSPGTDSIVD